MRKLILLFSVLLLSCLRQTQDDGNPAIISIDVSGKETPSKDAEVTSIIPLETSDYCLLSWIGDLRFNRNQIYILNNNRFKNPGVFLFDHEGRFVSKTKVGKGPGEMIEPYAFTIIDSKAQIFVHDQAQSTAFIFDSGLNFVQKINKDYTFMSQLEHIVQDTFLVAHHIPVSREDLDEQFYSLTLYADDFKWIKHLDILLNRNQSLHLTHSISRFDDEILFLAPYRYEVYTLDNQEAKVKYLLDFGNTSLPADKLHLLSDDDYSEIMERGELVLPVSIFQTKEYVVLQVGYLMKPMIYLISKQNHRVFHLNLQNILPESCFLHDVTPDGIFVTYSQAYDFVEFQNDTGLYQDNHISEGDNPVVFLFEIK